MAEVENYQRVIRQLKQEEKAIRLGVNREIRHAAEPVSGTAQTYALERITSMPKSPSWSRMRVGITQKGIYVAPRQRGKKAGPQKRGRQFANLMMDRAMEPALDAHKDGVVRDVERLVDREAARFNRMP